MVAATSARRRHAGRLRHEKPNLRQDGEAQGRFFLKTIGTDEEKTQEAEEKTALAEKIKKNQKRTKDPEEVEKALQCVALMDDRHPRIEGAG